MVEHLVSYFGGSPVQLSHNVDVGQDLYVRETERSNEETVIDQLEVSQLSGALERDKKVQQVILRLSQYGVQIMAADRKRTIRRVPLLNVLFTVAYDDGFGRYNCAVVINSRIEPGQCEAHVFQAESRTHADRIILDVDNLFKRVEEQCRNSPQMD